MSRPLKPPMAWVLVENGLHGGARLELFEPDTWYSVGGRVDSDFWLADEAVAEAQLRFAVRDGQVQVRLEAGPTASVDGMLLEEGAEASVRERLTWGGLGLRVVQMEVAAAGEEALGEGQDKDPDGPAPVAGLAAPARPAPMPGGARMAMHVRSWLNQRTALGLLALVAVGVPLVLMLSMLSGFLDRFEQREARERALIEQDSPQARLARAAEAASRLADLIGLPNVSVTVVDATSLALTGSGISPEMQTEIQKSMLRFDPTYQVFDKIDYGIEAPPKPVPMPRLPEGANLAQFDDDGFLRGRDGVIYLPGSRLPDGSELVAVNGREFQFKRGPAVSVLSAPQMTMEAPAEATTETQIGE